MASGSIHVDLGKQLVDADSLKYQGFYRFPQRDQSTRSKFGYGTHAATWSKTRGTLYVAGYDHHYEIAELSIPDSEPGNEEFLVRLHTMQSLTDPAPALADERALWGLDRLGGIAEVLPLHSNAPAVLALTYHKYYAVQPLQEIDAPTLTVRGLSLARTDSSELMHVGPTGVLPFHQKFTANYCCEILPRWRSEFSWLPLAVGKGDGPGNATSPKGPTLFATGVLPVGDTLQTPALELLRYTEEHPIEDWRATDRWEGAAWLDWKGRSAVVFAGTRGVGETWYGFPDAGPNGATDPYRRSKGQHSEAYAAEFRFYDPADFVRVVKGELESWEPRPYAVKRLQLSKPTNEVGGIAWDPEHGRLFVCERNGEDPRLHVWQTDAAASEEEKDDDGAEEFDAIRVPDLIVVEASVSGHRFSGTIGREQ